MDEFKFGLIELLNQYLEFDKSNNQVRNIFGLIKSDWFSGDLILYLNKQLHKKESSISKLNQKMIDVNCNKLEEYIRINMEHINDFPFVKPSDFVLEEHYSTSFISSLASNNNIQTGMYDRIINKVQYVIIKATIHNKKNKYYNEWLDSEKGVLKYYCKFDKSDDNSKLKYRPNRIVSNNINNKMINIMVFTRNKKKSDYVFKGYFCAVDNGQDDNGSYFIFSKDRKKNEEASNFKTELEADYFIDENKKWTQLPDALIKKYEDKLTISITNKFRNSYLQKKFRDKLLNRSRIRCEICGLNFEPLLIASHIKPVAKILIDDNLNNMEKTKEFLDDKNGLLLCTQHDALFDAGWISFDDEGNLMCSNKLDAVLKKHLFGENMAIDKNKYKSYYMDYHRKNIFIE